MIPNSGLGTSVVIQIVNPPVPVRTEESSLGGRRLVRVFFDQIEGEMAQRARKGGLGQELQSAFGLRRLPVRR